ncbi:YgjP-like metallopeptidase domain-containing protein [Helicobacter sp. MIT 05-5294]|uniref:M48 family metallopeptidase n=1 Tax=Helicobacter sp. MIT 05-5294 TaxID=1548150 RepID=UPI00051FD82A|nr:YgjP-like metallopeptidase domain-containing protein [Helicobacter sp. MIT 05-5294]TLD85735.1 DUF45 domain-containing protein [Helicobacter sp. MIT 05-5294]
MFQRLKLPENFPPNLAVKIVQKRNFRHLKMRVDCDSCLIVNVPKYATKKECERFLNTNLQWILERFKESLKAKIPLVCDKFYLFGEWVVWDTILSLIDKKLELRLRKRLKITEKDDLITSIREFWRILMQEDNQEDSQKRAQNVDLNSKLKGQSVLICLYQRALESYVESRMGEISQAMQLFPSRIEYGKSYRQLGCCKSKDQSIRFSLRLALMPHFCIDSVIIHELAHLRYPHHQRDFWNLVRTFDSNPKGIDLWLRTNSYLQAQFYKRIFIAKF